MTQKAIDFCMLDFNLPLEQILVLVLIVFSLIPLGFLVRQSSANND